MSGEKSEDDNQVDEQVDELADKEYVVCRACGGDGCSRCDFDGFYCPDDVEPDGTN